MVMNTQKIEKKSEHKVVQHGRAIAPWVKIIVWSTIVMALAIALMIVVSNTMTNAKELIQKYIDEKHGPESPLEIIKPMIPLMVLLVLFIGLGIPAFVINLKTGIRAKENTNFGPKLMTMLFCIISAAACFIIFAALIGAMVPDIIGAAKEMSTLLKATETPDPSTMFGFLDAIDDKAKILNILIIVLTGLQVVYAILQLVLKNKKK